eukprot:358951-Chlamydomonas_euryale.AAC.9
MPPFQRQALYPRPPIGTAPNDAGTDESLRQQQLARCDVDACAEPPPSIVLHKVKVIVTLCEGNCVDTSHVLMPTCPRPCATN